MDLRTPMGLLFSVLGLLLLAFGLTHTGAVFTPTGVNINLDWGGVLLLFGVVMLLLARRAKARQASQPATKQASAHSSRH